MLGSRSTNAVKMADLRMMASQPRDAFPGETLANHWRSTPENVSVHLQTTTGEEWPAIQRGAGEFEMFDR
jgi:hypothetical protein